MVVLPASMWAMMPILRTLLRSAMSLRLLLWPLCLPPVVREGFVGFGHLVVSSRFFTLAPRPLLASKFVGKALEASMVFSRRARE